MEPDRAQIASAMRWANGQSAELDLDIEAWGRHVPKTVTERTITAAWDYARACASTSLSDISDAEWNDLVAPWQAAWREAMA
jgi:hypothetical protein